jgi:hypothetical protein
LKLDHHKLLSTFAFNFNLRHYIEANESLQFITRVAHQLRLEALPLEKSPFWLHMKAGTRKYRPPRHRNPFRTSFLS